MKLCKIQLFSKFLQNPNNPQLIKMRKQKFLYLLFFIIGLFLGAVGMYIYHLREVEAIQALYSGNKYLEKESVNNSKYSGNKEEKSALTSSETKETETHSVNDPVEIDSLQTNPAYFTEENTEVAKDELLKVLNIELPVKTSNQVDSLLINDKTPEITKLTVEFWISPIHYTGYQMNRSKLVLFGVKQPEKASFEFIEEGKIRLKYKENNLVLELSDDFRPIKLKNK